MQMKIVNVYDLEDFKARFKDAHDWALERNEDTEVRILRSDNREWLILEGMRYALCGHEAKEADSFSLIRFLPHVKRYYVSSGLGAIGVDVASEEYAFLDDGFDETAKEIGRGEYAHSIIV